MTNFQAKLAQRLTAKKKGNLIEKGFTLVELLIVVVILGILSGVALPSLLAQRDRAVIAGANASASALITSCEIDITNGDDPTAAAGETARLAAVLPDNPVAIATLGEVEEGTQNCVVTVSGSGTEGDGGTFTAFGVKTPATYGAPTAG